MKAKTSAWVLTMMLITLSSLLSAQQSDKSSPVPFKPALLVIDIQNAYLPLMDEKDVKPGMEAIDRLIEWFRANQYPVIRVYHTEIGQGPEPGSEPFEFPKSVRIKDSDSKVIKNYPSAFTKTDLDRILKEKDINTLFISGLSAVGCALATYFGALDRQYDAFMVREAIMSHKAEYTDVIRNITGSVPMKSVHLSMKILSGDTKFLETLPPDTLIRRYEISDANELNSIGYYMIFKNRLTESIPVFRANVRLFPDEANCYDSLGDAYERNNQKDLAVASYEQACQIAKKKNDQNLSVFEKNYQRLKSAVK